MTQTASKRLAIGFAALAAAGVIGGVTAVSLVGQQEQPARQVRTVSDEASATPPAATPSASPTAVPTNASPTPAKTTTKTTTQNRNRTLTEPTTTEPAPEPTPTETNTGTADNPPAPRPPAPTLQKCYDQVGNEIPCKD